MFTYIHRRTGKTLYLHRKLSKSKRSFVWYFDDNPENAVDLPLNLEVIEGRNMYPIVRKKRFNKLTTST